MNGSKQHETTTARARGLSRSQFSRTSRIGFLRRVGLMGLLVAGHLAVVSGCQSDDREINAFIHDWEASVSGTIDVVQPPDAIEIYSPDAPEIDGEVQTIDSAGKVSLRLIGQVKVAGMTTVEIARKLEAILSKYYSDPTVRVRIAQRRSRRIYVFGEVGRSGPFPYTGRDTVLSVLAKANLSFLAWKSQIKVIRPSHDEQERHVIVVDADKIMQKGDLEMNVLLEEGDIIYVPPTPLAWLGLRTREIMFPARQVTQAALEPGYVDVDFQYAYSNSVNNQGGRGAGSGRGRSGR